MWWCGSDIVWGGGGVEIAVGFLMVQLPRTLPALCFKNLVEDVFSEINILKVIVLLRR